MTTSETKKATKPDQGLNVKVRRTRLGWGQDTLADLMNEKFGLKLNQGKISDIENKDEIPEETLKQLAEIMQCDLEFLRDFTIDDYFNPKSMTQNAENNLNGEQSSISEFMQNKTQTINNYFPPEIAEMYKDLLKQEKEIRAKEIECLTKQVEALSKENGKLKERLDEK